jgi:ATP-dependent Lon protease
MAVLDPRNVEAASQAFSEHNLVVVIPVHGPKDVVGSIGTLAVLRNMVPITGGGARLQSKGLWRVRVDRLASERPYLRVRFSRADSQADIAPGRSNTMKVVFGQIDEFMRLIPGIPPEIGAFLREADAPGKLADLCAYSPFFTIEEKLDLLRTLDADQRLDKVSKLFERRLVELKKSSRAKTIPECVTCMDLADKAFELGPTRSAEVVKEFLDHVVLEHPGEVLTLIAERYGPMFLKRRAMR